MNSMAIYTKYLQVLGWSPPSLQVPNPRKVKCKNPSDGIALDQQFFGLAIRWNKSGCSGSEAKDQRLIHYTTLIVGRVGVAKIDAEKKYSKRIGWIGCGSPIKDPPFQDAIVSHHQKYYCITMFSRESWKKPSFPTMASWATSKSNEPNWETGKVAPCPAAHDQFHWSSQPSNKWREGLHFDKGIHWLCLSNWEKSNNPEKTPSLRHVWMYQKYIYIYINIPTSSWVFLKKKHLESSSEHESNSDEILPVGCDSLTGHGSPLVPVERFPAWWERVGTRFSCD